MFAANKTAVNAKCIAIVGDGPMAFITAIKLKQLGLNNVTIVGPRVGEFTRSGDFHQRVFSMVSSAIAPLEVKPSVGSHIKDVERQLFDQAKNLGITIIKQLFTGFGNTRELILADGTRIKADLIFDCTGTKRALINKFNERPEPGLRFDIIKPIKALTPRHYAMVRAHLDPRDVFIFNQQLGNPNRLPYVLIMEKMRGLGWPHPFPPHAYANQFPDRAKKSQSSFQKTNIYCQIPPGLTKSEVLEFIQLAFMLANNETSLQSLFKINLHKDSQKFQQKKPILTTFTIDPRQVRPIYYMGDNKYGTIFIAGDASGDIPFTMAKSLIQAVKKLNDILPAFEVFNNAIVAIDFQQVNLAAERRYKKQENLLSRYFQSFTNRQSFWNNIENIFAIYKDAYSTCLDPINSQMIKKRINQLAIEYVLHFLNLGRYHLQDILDDATGLNHKSLFFQTKLDQCIEYYTKASKLNSDVSDTERNAIAAAWNDLADRCKKLGSHYLQHSPANLAAAEKYYQLALNCYADVASKAYVVQQLALYSNLVIVAYKKYAYTKILELVEQYNKNIYPFVNQEIKSLIIQDKIFYHAALANIAKAQALLKNTPLNEKQFDFHVSEVDLYINKLSCHSKEFATQLQRHVDNVKNSQLELAGVKKDSTPEAV